VIGFDRLNGLARGNLVQIFLYKRVFEVFALPLWSRDRTPAGLKGLALCKKGVNQEKTRGELITPDAYACS